MIRIKQEDRTILLEYETGEDCKFLSTICQIIEMRNEDKEWIKGLKEELM